MKKLPTLVSLSLFMLAGCSQKAIYKSIQDDAKRACERHPPSQYDECIEQHSESYESYKKSRDAALEQDEH